MSWGRGFFRVWVVLSVVWIGFVAYIYAPSVKTPTQYLGGYPVAQDEDQKPKHIDQFSDDFSALEAGAIAKRVRQYELDLGPDFPSPVQMFGSMSMTEDEFTRRLKGQIDYIRADLKTWIAGKRMEKIIEATEVALGVPLGFLVAGFAVHWILRGFRSPKPHPQPSDKLL